MISLSHAKSVLHTFIRRLSSFTYLNTTQFLGALNDNIYKLLIVYQFIQLEGIENSHNILAMTGTIFVLPFLLFSASSGTLADRFSKRNIIVITKLLELITMSLGVICFTYQSKWGSYGILFLLAAQSAVFGPSKYGILPEIVPSDKISKANGLMSSFTFLAIILGTFFASFLIDITGRNFILASLFCTCIALIGLITSCCIEYTPPSGASTSSGGGNIFKDIKAWFNNALHQPWLLVATFGSIFFFVLGIVIDARLFPKVVNFLYLNEAQGGYVFFLAAVIILAGSILISQLLHVITSLKVASQQPSLLVAIFGSAFFLFLGAFVQLNMIPFAVESLNLSDVQGGYLFLLTAIGIGAGSLLAGKISGRTVELGLVPIAGVGVTVSCYMLDLLSDNLTAVIPMVVLVGLFGGMYQIPLDSYIQVASPNKSRGQIVAATNVLSFIGVLLASGLLFMNSEVFHFKADKGFTIVGSITIFVTAVIGFQFFDYLTRFIGMILARLHFKTAFTGLQNIPDTPTVYVCTHTAWNDTLLILGSQRRRVRFFIEEEQDHSRWMKRLYRLLRVVLIASIEPLEHNPVCLSVIRKTLKKGISVCIFVNNEDICAEIEKLKLSFAFRAILEENHYPMIPVAIEKGEKHNRSRFFTRLMKKFRVPASISFGSKINEPLPLIQDESDPDYCSCCS